MNSCVSFQYELTEQYTSKQTSKIRYDMLAIIANLLWKHFTAYACGYWLNKCIAIAVAAPAFVFFCP